MAKSARSSTNKSNNQKLKSRVFGPVEKARTERLSAKLLELASAPRPAQKDEGDVTMETEKSAAQDGLALPPVEKKQITGENAMEVDQTPNESVARSKPSGKGRVEKKRSRRSKAGIVFPKYKDGKRVGRSKK